MPNWRKVITSGSDASLNSINVTNNVISSQIITSQLSLYDTVIGENGNIFLTDGNYSFRNNSGDDVLLINTSSINFGIPGKISSINNNSNTGNRTINLQDKDGTIAFLSDITSPSGSISGSFTGSFTGSLQGTASNAISASWAPIPDINTGSLATTGSNIFNGNQILTGSLQITNGITGSLLSNELSGYTTDLSSSYTSRSFVDRNYVNNASNISSGTLADARLSSNVPKMVSNVLPAVDGSLLTNLNPASIATVIQTITATATINNSTTTLLVNPATVVSSLSITFCAAPYQTQIIRIVFGGTITSGNQVVTTLSILPNSGQSVVRVFPSVEAFAGDFLAFQYINTNWYQIN